MRDLVDACCRAYGAKWFMRDSERAEDMEGSPMARQLAKLPSEERDFIVEAINTVGPDYPVFASSNSSVSLNGTFRHFTAEVKWFHVGFKGVRFISGAIDFTPQWANPFWELLFDVTAEESVLVSRLYESLRRATQSPWAWLPLHANDLDIGAKDLDIRAARAKRWPLSCPKH